MQHVDDASPPDSRGIVHTGIREVVIVAKLLRAFLRGIQHVLFASKVQTARGARLNARWLKAFLHSIRAKRALEDAICLRIHLRNVEGATGDAIAAANAVSLLEIDDAIRVLHDGP